MNKFISLLVALTLAPIAAACADYDYQETNDFLRRNPNIHLDEVHHRLSIKWIWDSNDQKVIPVVPSDVAPAWERAGRSEMAIGSGTAILGSDRRVIVGGKSLEEMFEAGKYTEVAEEINETNFPSLARHSPPHYETMVLLTFRHEIDEEEFLFEEMKALHLHPANIEECLAYGEAIAKERAGIDLGIKPFWLVLDTKPFWQIQCLGSEVVETEAYHGYHNRRTPWLFSDGKYGSWNILFYYNDYWPYVKGDYVAPYQFLAVHDD